MESQLHRPQEEGDPHRVEQGQSEQHKEKKLLKKVKEKAKKIKTTITKHGHCHKQGNGQGISRGGTAKEVHESTVIESKDLPQEAKINQELNKRADNTKSDPDDGREMDHSKDHEKQKPDTCEQAQRRVLNKESADKPESGQESAQPENVTSKDANTATEPEPESESHRDKPITETVSEYAHTIAEKLKPSQEDKALSEAVTDKLEKAAEGMHLKDNKEEREEGPPRLGEVRESEEVRARLGPLEENKREGKDAFQSGVESSGETVADRVKDAVSSWLGKSEGTQTAKQSVGESYANIAGGGGASGEGGGGGDGGSLSGSKAK